MSKIRSSAKINKNSPQYKGLIGYWPAIKPGGNKLYDVIRGNHGTLTNMTDINNNWVIESERNGYVLDFDGVDDYVSIPNMINIATSNISIFMWVRLDLQISGSSQIIFQQEGTSGRGLLWRKPAGNNLASSIGGSETSSVSAPFSTTGVWHHVGVTYDGTTVKLYIDGIQDGSAAKVAESETGDFRVGHHKTSGSSQEEWKGKIDDIRIYDRVLTEQEVRYIYNPQTRWDLFAEPELQLLGLASVLGDVNGVGGAIVGGLAEESFVPSTQTFNENGSGGALTGGSTINQHITTNSGSGGIAIFPFNPVHYWNFDDGTGTILADNMGDNDGTLSASMTSEDWVSGNPKIKFSNSNALDFDGDLDWVNISSQPNVNSVGSFTYSIWLYVRSYTNGTGSSGTSFIDRQYIGFSGDGFPLVTLKANSDRFMLQQRYDTGALTQISGPGGEININTWQHVVIVRDYNNEFALYVDGIKTKNISDSGASLHPDPPKIASHSSGSPTFDGQIDDFRIYDYALNQRQIKDLASGNEIEIAELLVISDKVAIGGAIVGGTDENLLLFIPPITGGILIGGLAGNQHTSANNGNGGVILGGTSDESFNDVFVTDGGILIGGTATDNTISISPTIGGILIGGSATDNTISNTTAIGGILIGGLANDKLINFINTNGGAFVSGLTPVNLSYAIKVDGGALINGSATIVSGSIYNEIGNGGVLTSGLANETLIDFVDVNGGILVSGIANVVSLQKINATGGVVSNGIADITSLYTIKVNGGSLIGGIANNGLGSDIATEGGSLIGGSAIATHTSNIITIGGIVVKGYTTISFFNKIYGIGGAIIGGHGSLIFDNISTGGVFVGGRALGRETHIESIVGIIVGSSGEISTDHIYKTTNCSSNEFKCKIKQQDEFCEKFTSYKSHGSILNNRKANWEYLVIQDVCNTNTTKCSTAFVAPIIFCRREAQLNIIEESGTELQSNNIEIPLVQINMSAETDISLQFLSSPEQKLQPMPKLTGTKTPQMALLNSEENYQHKNILCKKSNLDDIVEKRKLYKKQARKSDIIKPIKESKQEKTQMNMSVETDISLQFMTSSEQKIQPKVGAKTPQMASLNNLNNMQRQKKIIYKKSNLDDIVEKRKLYKNKENNITKPIVTKCKQDILQAM